MNHDTAEQFYVEREPTLAADKFTNAEKLFPGLRQPIEDAFGLADPRLSREAIEQRSVALRAAAFEAGLSGDDLGVVVRTVAGQLRSPLNDAQQLRNSQNTMQTLRMERRQTWDADLKHASALIDGKPALARFLAMAPGARSDESVARLLVERGRDAHRRGVLNAARAGN